MVPDEGRGREDVGHALVPGVVESRRSCRPVVRRSVLCDWGWQRLRPGLMVDRDSLAAGSRLRLRSHPEPAGPPSDRAVIPPRLVTTVEMANILRMNPSTFPDIARRREFPRWRIGRAVRYDPDEILALLREEPHKR